MFPGAPQPWLDLSTGLNPFAYPFQMPDEHSFTRLPDLPEALEACAARAYEAPPPIQIVAAPGSQALIQALPRLHRLDGKPSPRIGILGMTYAEHALNWRAVGARVQEDMDLDALATMDVAIVVNPNNPDGRLLPPAALLDLAARLSKHGGLLIVDEAFMDFEAPETHFVPVMPENGVLVLRSFGKAYGLGGLRLGFALTGPKLAADLRAWFGPWAVSGPAIAIGRQALGDSLWLVEARKRLETMGTALDRLLCEAGFAVLGGTRLYRLVTHEKAAAWFARLGEAGIFVRRFAERPLWLRFGIPGDAPALSRLAEALKVGIR